MVIGEIWSLGMSQARAFFEHLKTHPQHRQDVEAWKRFKVKNIIYDWNSMGFYKVNAFFFKDGSCISDNLVYD